MSRNTRRSQKVELPLFDKSFYDEIFPGLSSSDKHQLIDLMSQMIVEYFKTEHLPNIKYSSNSRKDNSNE